MTTHPRVLKLLPLFLVLVAASFPVQIMLLYGHSPFEIDAILSKISMINEVVIGLCLVTAFALYRASSMTQILVPILLFTVGFNNGVVSSVGEDFSPLMAILATVGFFSAHVSLLRPEILMLFKNPKSRWWLTQNRKQLEVPMMLTHMNQELVIRSKTFDLSENGTFISFLQAAEPATHLKVNDSISVCLNLGALTQIRCQAKVVRVTDAKGNYPAGLALSFETLKSKEKRKIKEFMNRAS